MLPEENQKSSAHRRQAQESGWNAAADIVRPRRSLLRRAQGTCRRASAPSVEPGCTSERVLSGLEIPPEPLHPGSVDLPGVCWRQARGHARRLRDPVGNRRPRGIFHLALPGRLGHRSGLPRAGAPSRYHEFCFGRPGPTRLRLCCQLECESNNGPSFDEYAMAQCREGEILASSHVTQNSHRLSGRSGAALAAPVAVGRHLIHSLRTLRRSSFRSA